MKNLNFDDFVQSYLMTAAWVTVDSYTSECDDFTSNGKRIAENDCRKFIDMVEKTFGKEKANSLLTIEGNDLSYLAPHDFFLTRNSHGTGFWDKEETYGIEEAKILTSISKELGSAECYHITGKKSKLTF